MGSVERIGAGEPATCSRGELCGGRRHRVLDGRWRRCDCFLESRRLDRYRDGGFAERYYGISAKEAIDQSGIHSRSAEVLEALARECGRRSAKRHLLLQGSPGSAPEVLACYMAARLAASMPVWRCDVDRLVEERFDRPDERALTAAVRSTNTALFCRLGYSGRHAWLGPMLARVAIDRHEASAVSIFYCDTSVANLEPMYGPLNLHALLSRSVIY